MLIWHESSNLVWRISSDLDYVECVMNSLFRVCTFFSGSNLTIFKREKYVNIIKTAKTFDECYKILYTLSSPAWRHLCFRFSFECTWYKIYCLDFGLWRPVPVMWTIDISLVWDRINYWIINLSASDLGRLDSYVVALKWISYNA